MSLFIRIRSINKTENYCCFDEISETRFDHHGELYRTLIKEYGRCTGKVYVDNKQGKPQHIGWIFLQRRKYDDVPETFLCETWVSVYSEEPKKVLIETFASL